MSPKEILPRDYTYHLPGEQIAEYPLLQRDAARLLVYKSGRIVDNHFFNLSDQFSPGVTMILNDTKVVEARILFQKPSGGTIEIFCLEPYNQSLETALQQCAATEWRCLVGGASKWKAGQLLVKEISIAGKSIVLNAKFIAKLDDAFVVQFNWQPEETPFIDVLHVAGIIPLPPYIKRHAEDTDAERYQTVFGRHNGSVAAPTAALHFSETVFERLHQKQIDTAFVTLHVGAGTFKPIKAETVAEHAMHGEGFTVKKEVLQKFIEATTIVAVGTTSLRTLESLYWLGLKLMKGLSGADWELEQWEAYDLDDAVTYKESLSATIEWMENHSQTALHCRTSLLIVPGYRFKAVDALLTNFHQPGSTLLLLVAAFIGEDWKKVYGHALENNYRFLSYGDSSLLWRG